MASRTPGPRFAAADQGRPLSGRNASDLNTDGFDEGLVDCMPGLRAFARSLTRHAESSDDLVQETLATALRNRHRYEPGTNQRAWLFTILRNLFLTDMRRRAREIRAVADPWFDRRDVQPPAQEDAMRFREVETAIRHLPVLQREALMLVGALGLAYQDAADIAQCEVGTIKSRVSRARRELARQEAAGA